MNTNKDSIASFIHHFETDVHAISLLHSQNKGYSHRDRIYKKALYSALIDALAKTVYPNTNSNRERFTNFIQYFSNWGDWNRVSLPHVVRFLELSPSPTYSKLRKYIFGLYNWSEGEVISISRDPTYEDILKFFPKKDDVKKDTLQEFDLIKIRHDNLLYQHRNALIHELRELGYGVEHDTDTTPLYTSVGDKAKDKSIFNLVYPLQFYFNICNSCINNMQKYFEENNINPYTAVESDFGDYWLANLNE